jgi:hypothetical protein
MNIIDEFQNTARASVIIASLLYAKQHVNSTDLDFIHRKIKICKIKMKLYIERFRLNWEMYKQNNVNNVIISCMLLMPMFLIAFSTSGQLYKRGSMKRSQLL